MQKKAAVLIVVGLILIAGISFFAVKQAVQLQKEKELVVGLQAKLQELETLKDGLTRQLTAEKELSGSLKQKLEEAAVKMADLAKELEQKVASYNELSQKLTLDQSSAVELQQKLTSASGELEALRAQLAKLEQSNKRLQNELTLKASAPVATKIPLDTIVVQQSPAAAQPTEGTVLVVNDEYNFIVTNLGKVQGIKPGDVVSVRRDGQTIGSVTAEDILADMSVLRFVPAQLKMKIKEGDRVVR
jgi:myosin heavy subunit